MEVLTGKLESSKDVLRKNHTNWLERKIKKIKRKISANKKKDSNF